MVDGADGHETTTGSDAHMSADAPPSSVGAPQTPPQPVEAPPPAECDRCDLTGAHLSGYDLAHASFKAARLRGAEVIEHNRVLELQRDGDKWSGWLINEPDRSPIPKVTWDGAELVLERLEVRRSLEIGIGLAQREQVVERAAQLLLAAR